MNRLVQIDVTFWSLLQQIFMDYTIENAPITSLPFWVKIYYLDLLTT